MAKPKKWDFNPGGAEKMLGGYCGPSEKFSTPDKKFHFWYVTNANGNKFQRSHYVDGGWKVQKNRLTSDDKPIWYAVKDPIQIRALDDFCGLQPYAGYGK